MFDYLTKFNKLPKELQAVVSSPAAMRTVGELENKYGVDLAVLAIKIMIKETPWDQVAPVLVRDHKLDQRQAAALQAELAEKIFAPVKKYLGIWKQEGTRDGGTHGTQNTTQALGNPQSKIQNLKSADNGGHLAVNARLINEFDEKLKVVMPKVLSVLGATGKDELTQVRLRAILKSFSKGIRDFISAREALMKEAAAGGLGLAQKQAEAILNLAQGKITNEAHPLAKPTPQYWEETRDVEYDFSALKPMAQTNQDKAPVTTGNKQDDDKNKLVEEIIAELEAAADADEAAKSEKLISGTEDKKLLPPSAAQVAAPAADHIASHIKEPEPKERSGIAASNKEEAAMPAPVMRVARPRAANVPNKPLMEDITRPSSRLQGPVEELANLDLINFRRLGGSPEVIASKIQNKIKLLEQESFTRRQQGVNAWRRSPIYQSYVALGREAMQTGKQVGDLLKEQAVKRKDILTAEEFNAILELNRKLRV